MLILSFWSVDGSIKKCGNTSDTVFTHSTGMGLFSMNQAGTAGCFEVFDGIIELVMVLSLHWERVLEQSLNKNSKRPVWYTFRGKSIW